MNARIRAIGGLLVGNLLGSVVWFPFWWYTTGLKRVVNCMTNVFHNQLNLIRIDTRSIVRIWRVIACAVEAIVLFVLLCLWMLAPVAFAFLFLTSVFRTRVV